MINCYKGKIYIFLYIPIQFSNHISYSLFENKFLKAIIIFSKLIHEIINFAKLVLQYKQRLTFAGFLLYIIIVVAIAKNLI